MPKREEMPYRDCVGIAVFNAEGLVFIGRPFLYAAAVGGATEVQRAAQLLKAEIHRNMAMMGVTELAQLNRDYLLR